MKFSDWFRRKTPLQLALQRGMEKGKLADEIRELGDVSIKSRHDAEAICEVLAAIAEGKRASGDGFKSELRAVAGLFQEIESGGCDAFPVLAGRGTLLLQQVVASALASADKTQADDVLFILKIQAMYGTREGADMIVRLAREDFRSEDWMWSVIFGIFNKGHPMANFVFASLSNPLPRGFVAVAMLDAANRFFIEGGELRHPFDSDEGAARLAAWIGDPNDEHFSYAKSAVAALPFINHPKQSELLDAATQHPSPDVRLESAWAAAKLDRKSGFHALAAMCLDVNFASRARGYLRELKRLDLVPAEASTPDFVAKAEFAQWLAHPNELGRPPDELDLYDQRALRWPPEFEDRPVWLWRYVVRQKSGLEHDDVGVGMVGSVIFCFFSYDMEQRPPEDCYALHCFWEMERNGIVVHAVEANEAEYDGMLSQWTGAPLDGLRIEHVAELPADFRHPQKLIAVASGKRNGSTGWLVLDGSNSRWYSATEFVAEDRSQTILKIHVGRCLLGFSLEEERTKWLRPPAVIPDEQIVTAYEKLLSQCLSAPASEQATYFSGYSSPLSKHFESYVKAVTHLRHEAGSEVIVRTYEAILAKAKQTTAITWEEVFDSFGPVGKHFDKYAAALIELGRSSDALVFVRELVPLWQHNLGYGKLGAIAFKAGDHPLAEELLSKLKAGLENWPRSEEMIHLAEIWQQRGELDAARNLVLECLRYTLAEAAEATGSDVGFHEKIYQCRRKDFERLFVDITTLDELGLPHTTLTSRNSSS